jgi:hypothetical protein
VASASIRRRNRRQKRSRRIRESLTSIVPVQVPLQQRIARKVQLCAFLADRHLGTVLPTSHVDVETLRPELSLRHWPIIVNRDDFCTQDVVSIGNITWDCHALGVVIVVEDGIGACLNISMLGLSGIVGTYPSTQFALDSSPLSNDPRGSRSTRFGGS